MLYPKNLLFTICLIILSICNSYAQSWLNVGYPRFSAGSAKFTTMATAPDGTLYVAFQDNSSSDKASVMKFNGTSWVVVGVPGLSTGKAESTSIAIDGSGTPYVAFVDFGNAEKVMVLKYDGINWVPVGSSSLPNIYTENTSITIDGNGTLYLVYMDYIYAGNITVMKYDGVNWITLGSPGFAGGMAYFMSIAIDHNGTPYVSFLEEEFSGTDVGASVMKYDGSKWVYVGSPRFSASYSYYQSLAIAPDGTPYVVYRDDAIPTANATVMKYNGSSWVNVGNPGFSKSIVYYTSIAIDGSGTPYVAFRDGAGDGTTVMKYNGASWINVGNPSFSEGWPSYIDLVIDPYGTPYVVYAEKITSPGDEGPVTVMKFGWPTHVKSTTTVINPFSVFPNPNHGSFSLVISSQEKRDITITINNAFGELVKELTASTNTEIQINLNTPPGMYFITATTAHEKQTTKIVVQ